MSEDTQYMTRSPDELFLELIDTLNLAFPAPVREAVVTFGPTEDGQEAALTDLDAVVDNEAPKRPELGHTDEEVLAVINAVVGEISHSVHERSCNRILLGRIEVKNQLDDGETEVWVVEKNVDGASDDDDMLHVKRRFDKSELVWLVHTSALYSRLNDTSDVEEQQDRGLKNALQKFTRFGANLNQGLLSFFAEDAGDDEGVDVNVQLIGSYAPTHEALLWGWADDAAPKKLRMEIDAFRDSILEEGLRALYQAELLCPLPMAERLFRHAAVRMGQKAVYTAVMEADGMEQFVYFGLDRIPGALNVISDDTAVDEE